MARWRAEAGTAQAASRDPATGNRGREDGIRRTADGIEIWGNVERLTVERRGTSIPDYIDWRDKSRSFDLMSAWDNNNFIRYGRGAPEQISAEIVAGDYFTILGVEPLAGRVLSKADDPPGSPLVVVIGERLWERAFGRRPDAIGQSMRLDSQVFTIVGVTPAGGQRRPFNDVVESGCGADDDDEIAGAAGHESVHAIDVFWVQVLVEPHDS